jgi:hypothetical protein
MIPTSTLFFLRASSLQFAAQLPYKMFWVNVGINELGALTHHFRQNFVAVQVNRYHLNHFNYVSPRVACEKRFSPSRLKFIRPLVDQLTLQGPPLPFGQIGYSDFQHVALDCLPKTAGA